MKLPLSWLKEYVDIDCSVEELKNKLFSCGFEVEDVINVANNIKNVVTCRILSIDKHPNADKLSVTKVDAGKFGELQIVTNGKNIVVGDIVPVALDGATLANVELIKSGELRGVLSQGMFCGGEEIGINDDWYQGASFNGILVLDKKFPVGKDIKEVLNLNDVIFDINVTANRPDCQSILGLAREVSAILKKPLKMPNLTFNVKKGLSTKKQVNVIVDDKQLCSRYISYLVDNIKIEQSPIWLKQRLFLMGLRSINNIVDITNYVLLEIGQPMHAFDMSNIDGNQLVIRRANDNEIIKTLDNKDFKLNNENLVICDSNKPIALAGVMGGLNSEIKESTKTVLFESARFARDNIRKTARKLGQRTDASGRYEKGVDVYSPEIGIKRALSLISQLNCGDIAEDYYDYCYASLDKKIIKTTFSNINGVLGIEVPKEIIKEILLNLNFEVESNGDDISVTVPLYREDMDSYPDIAEEIIREYGYDKIQPTLLKTSEITNGGKNFEQNKNDSIKDFLVGMGFNEIITYSFVSEKEYELFGIDKESEGNKPIKLLNPLGEDLSVMRTSLLPSIIRIVSSNMTRKNFDGRLFEMAKIYKAKSLPLSDLPTEYPVISLAVFGENEDFFTLKGVVENILNAYCNSFSANYIQSSNVALHPTRSCDIVINGIKIGYFGQLNPILSKKLDIDKPVYCGEIYYYELEKFFNDKIIFKQISKFQPVERDLAIIVNEDIKCSNIIDLIKSVGGNDLESIKLFDIYQGDQIEKDKKSIAFNLIFSSLEKTFSLEETDNKMKEILCELEKKFNAKIR